METTTNIKSTIKPETFSIDDKYAYERSNIQQIIEIDPVFEKESILYSYDENKYTVEEWNKICIDKLNRRVDDLEKYLAELEKKIGRLAGVE